MNISIKDKILEKKVYILEQLNLGRTLNSVSKELGFNSGRIYQVIENLPIKKRSIVYGNIDSYKDKIIDFYNKDYSCYAIAKELNLAKRTVIISLKKWGYNTSKKSKQRVDKLKKYKQEIIELYKTKSSIEIANIYKCSHVSILKILNKNGINTSKDVYNFNRNYFNKIDCESKAWILGLWYTDGNVRKYGIRLTMTDLDIIEKVKCLICYKGPIRIIEPRKKNRKIQYELGIFQKSIADQLINLQCVPTKTYINKFPSLNIVPRELQRHFIRGALDGDGSITKKFIAITGTIDFLKGIEDSVYYHLGIKFKWYNRYPKKGKNYPIRMIAIMKKNERKQLFNWLYASANYFGERKFEKGEVLWHGKMN